VIGQCLQLGDFFISLGIGRRLNARYKLVDPIFSRVEPAAEGPRLQPDASRVADHHARLRPSPHRPLGDLDRPELDSLVQRQVSLDRRCVSLVATLSTRFARLFFCGSHGGSVVV